MEDFFSLLGASGIGAGLMVLIQKIIERFWKKKDKREEQETKENDETKQLLAALVENAKVMTIDRYHEKTEQFIARGSLTLAEKVNMREMYTSYKSLGGNGHLDTERGEILNLPVRDE